MKVVYLTCGGDVHKKFLIATIIKGVQPTYLKLACLSAPSFTSKGYFSIYTSLFSVF